MFDLRPYQQEAIDAVHNYICTREGNPCIVLPTGSGKSVVMAALINKWKEDSPWIRGCILAHRKELVQQNVSKFKTNYGNEQVGIFSAGLGKRDYDAQILFASIDSIYKRSGEFQPFDFIFVDEAHRIPPAGEGKYRTFIKGCKRFNEKLRVIGWTATPFRMACGPICHKDYILNEICYEASITELIEQGYLCRLRSKVGDAQPELSAVKHVGKQDYVNKALSIAVNKSRLVESAVKEAVAIIQREQRKHIIFFCVDVEHCKNVSKALRQHGIYAPFITAKTSKSDRDRLLNDFHKGRLIGVCCVNVLTEGFDAPHVDCIVLLRPTLSPGLYSQMVGRGLRPHHSKSDCLALDFGNCIDEHGPIDLVGQGSYTSMAICSLCREAFPRSCKVCPSCGWVIPKQELARLERKESERRMHGDKASKKSILSNEPMVLKVDSVYLSRHCKDNKPDSLKVQYRCGMSIYREWVCLDHPGQIGNKAQQWWENRFGITGKKVSVADAIQDMFAGQHILEYTKTITVVKQGKWFKIINYNESLLV